MIKNFILCVITLFVSVWAVADTYTYDNLNRVTQVSFANGTAINYTYDAQGNLLTAANNTLFTTPGAPTGVIATLNGNSVSIGFTAPVSNGGNAITSYEAMSSTGSLAGNCTSPCSSIAIDGLTGGITYTFTVTALNAAGPGAPSMTSNSVTPVAPTIFTISTNSGTNGTISPASQAVISGDSTTFTITPDSGYLASASGCSGSLVGNTYTTGAISANCMVSATFTPNVIQSNLVQGWNLAGNSVEAPITVASIFNDASKVVTVWKWVTAGNSAGISYPAWAFYTPAQADGGQAYAASKGYGFLTTINAGEGFWVNAKTPFTSPLPAGNPVLASSFVPAVTTPATVGGEHALTHGWSLIATGDSPTPSQLDAALSTSVSTPPTAGQVYANLTSLWAWDATKMQWYFWAPALVNNGGLSAYLSSKGYLDFATVPSTPAGTLSPTAGVWVNVP
jgi:YD repeat-containing protein